MALGFLKSAREQPDQARAPTSADALLVVRPERTSVLSEVEQLGVGMFWATDAQGRLTFLSQRALQDLGPEGECLFGKPLAQVFSDIDSEPGAPTQRSLAFKLKAHSKLDEQVVAISGARGITRWWRLNGRPLITAKGEFLGYRGSAVDISGQYAYETQIARQSQIDELTGLANRRKLSERLTATLGAFRASQRSCALMMIDLDRFKQVNDTMGHPGGDELLKQVAQRSRSSRIVVKSCGWAAMNFKCCCPTWTIAVRWANLLIGSCSRFPSPTRSMAAGRSSAHR